jgi:soluble lytic murein transglycosylase
VRNALRQKQEVIIIFHSAATFFAHRPPLSQFAGISREFLISFFIFLSFVLLFVCGTGGDLLANAPLSSFHPLHYKATTLTRPPLSAIDHIISGYSAKNAENLGRAIRAVDDRKWHAAETYVRNDPVGTTLIRWLKVRTDDATWQEISNFLKENPHWPRQSNIFKNAEKRIPKDLSLHTMLEFWSGNPPHSHHGMILLGETLLTQNNSRAKLGEDWIRYTFMTHDIPYSESLHIIRNHSDLVKNLYNKRVNKWLWDKRVSQAKLLLNKLSSSQKKLALARIALASNYRNVDSYIAKVPSQLRNSDPGLIFDRIRWRFRKGKRDTALELLLQVDTIEKMGNYPSSWAYYRKYFSRRAFGKGRCQEAYDIASHHGLLHGNSFAELEWFSGWLSLTCLHNREQAQTHFKNLWNNVSQPISRARAAYWTARSAPNTDATNSWMLKAAEYQMTYYGQIAMHYLKVPMHIQMNDSFANPETSALSASFQPETILLMQAIVASHLSGNHDIANILIKHIALTVNANEWLYMRNIFDKIRAPYYNIIAYKTALQAGRTDIPLTKISAYPIPSKEQLQILYHATENKNIEIALIMAVMRQESHMNPNAISNAGAVGLMQLMPTTALATARKFEMQYSRKALMYDATYNITLGTKYLSSIIDSFDGSYLLGIASYNAGPNRVKNWIKNFGDPRQSSIDPIDWIESIPYSETKNYVQRVFEGLTVYRTYLKSSE